MALKSTEVTRAEYLPEVERKQLGIEVGLVVIETRNPNLRNELKAAPQGYSMYLKSLGEYNPADDTWDCK